MKPRTDELGGHTFSTKGYSIMKKELKPSPMRYAGDASKGFWKRINAVKGVRGNLLYTLGVALQNVETVFLQQERNMILELEEAEKRKS